VTSKSPPPSGAWRRLRLLPLRLFRRLHDISMTDSAAIVVPPVLAVLFSALALRLRSVLFPLLIRSSLLTKDLSYSVPRSISPLYSSMVSFSFAVFTALKRVASLFSSSVRQRKV